MDTDEPQSPTAEGIEIPIQPATEQEEASAATQSSGKKQGGRSNQSVKGRAKGRGRAQPAAKISTAEGTDAKQGLPTRRSRRESKKPEMYTDDQYTKPEQHEGEDAASQQQSASEAAPVDASAAEAQAEGPPEAAPPQSSPPQEEQREDDEERPLALLHSEPIIFRSAAPPQKKGPKSQLRPAPKGSHGSADQGEAAAEEKPPEAAKQPAHSRGSASKRSRPTTLEDDDDEGAAEPAQDRSQHGEASVEPEAEHEAAADPAPRKRQRRDSTKGAGAPAQATSARPASGAKRPALAKPPDVASRELQTDPVATPEDMVLDLLKGLPEGKAALERAPEAVVEDVGTCTEAATKLADRDSAAAAALAGKIQGLHAELMAQAPSDKDKLKEFLQQKGAAKKLTGLIKHLADHPLVRVHDACKGLIAQWKGMLSDKKPPAPPQSAPQITPQSAPQGPLKPEKAERKPLISKILPRPPVQLAPQAAASQQPDTQDPPAATAAAAVAFLRPQPSGPRPGKGGLAGIREAKAATPQVASLHRQTGSLLRNQALAVLTGALMSPQEMLPEVAAQAMERQFFETFVGKGLPPLTGPNKAYLERLKAVQERLGAADGAALRHKILRGEVTLQALAQDDLATLDAPHPQAPPL